MAALTAVRSAKGQGCVAAHTASVQVKLGHSQCALAHDDEIGTGAVWGAPLALELSAIAQICLSLSVTATFWLTLTAACVLAARLRNQAVTKYSLPIVLGVSLLLLADQHTLMVGADAWQGFSLPINALLSVSVLAFLGALMRSQAQAGRIVSSRTIIPRKSQL